MPDSVNLAIRAAQQRQGLPTQDPDQVVMKKGQNLVDTKDVFREPAQPKPIKRPEREDSVDDGF